MASMSMSDMPSMTATMTMSDMSTTMTMTGMTSETGGMDMSGMSQRMGMESMSMVFFTATNTALWSTAFVPNSQGQYAGVCIFLILLSAIFRALLALRCNLLRIYDRAIAARHTQLLTRKEDIACKDCPRPWRINEAALQAFFDTILAGVGYLLMLAVMTMNVGYFLSILGGVFLGSFIFGRWTGAAVH